MTRRDSLRELQQIPGVGEAIAEDLYGLGITSVRKLKGRNPGQLYVRLCRQTGRPVDRCMLYVFRCAVYFASHARHDAVLLRWWNWKDKGETLA